jgi:hypothetical protein
MGKIATTPLGPFRCISTSIYLLNADLMNGMTIYQWPGYPQSFGPKEFKFFASRDDGDQTLQSLGFIIAYDVENFMKWASVRTITPVFQHKFADVLILHSNARQIMAGNRGLLATTTASGLKILR